ncbi:hypothetical protein NUBL21977_20910 [Klebsiella quasipneumoniae]|nr:hypothetical protein NUBL21977_20910 [Klebsiella quasipneumoniae]
MPTPWGKSEIPRKIGIIQLIKGAQNRAAPGFIQPIMACIATYPAVNAEIYYLDKFIIYTYSLRA